MSDEGRPVEPADDPLEEHRGVEHHHEPADENPLDALRREESIPLPEPQLINDPAPHAEHDVHLAPAEPEPVPKSAAELEAELNAQATTGEAEEDERIPELHEQSADEIIHSEIKPNPKIDEVIPVLEEIFDEAEMKRLTSQGSILLPYHTKEELDKLYNRIARTIVLHQPARHEEVAEGGGDHLTQIDVPGRDQGRLYVTEIERQAMAMVAGYRAHLRAGHGATLFEEDHWTNMPKVGDSILAIAANNFAKSPDPLMRFRGAQGLSGEYPAPMWGSGLHMRLESPGALRGLQLEVAMLLEKIERSRDTMGYALSAPSVYLNSAVMDFILEHVHSTTLGTVNPEELKRVLRLNDLEPLAGASASTIYPDGFLLERPCLQSAGGCGHVVKRKINIRRQLFVRWERLSDHQKQFMSKRAGRVDVKTVLGYQNQTRPEISRFIDLKGGYSLKLEVPTFARYEYLSNVWMSKLTNEAKDLIVSNADRDQRDGYLARATNIALIMAYASWIEGIYYRESIDQDPVAIVSRTVTEVDKQYEADMKVDKELTDLSADGGQTQRIVDEIRKFIDDMTLSVFAVPKTKCPMCDKPLTGDEKSTHPHLVQLNAIELFFTLLRHKVSTSGK